MPTQNNPVDTVCTLSGYRIQLLNCYWNDITSDIKLDPSHFRKLVLSTTLPMIIYSCNWTTMWEVRLVRISYFNISSVQ